MFYCCAFQNSISDRNYHAHTYTYTRTLAHTRTDTGTRTHARMFAHTVKTDFFFEKNDKYNASSHTHSRTPLNTLNPYLAQASFFSTNNKYFLLIFLLVPLAHLNSAQASSVIRSSTEFHFFLFIFFFSSLPLANPNSAQASSVIKSSTEPSTLRPSAAAAM